MKNILNWQLSDEQLIERVQREQRYRRPIGALFVALGLASIALVSYVVYDRYAQAVAQVKQTAQAPQPTTEQVEEAFYGVRFFGGLMLGCCLGVGFLLACQTFGMGLGWFLNSNPKDKLLLKCWHSRPTAH